MLVWSLILKDHVSYLSLYGDRYITILVEGQVTASVLNIFAAETDVCVFD